VGGKGWKRFRKHTYTDASAPTPIQGKNKEDHPAHPEQKQGGKESRTAIRDQEKGIKLPKSGNNKNWALTLT